MSLSKQEFLEPPTLRVEPVDLPVKGGTVYIRKLDVDAQIQFEAEVATLDESDTKAFTAISLASYLCTESGEPFVTIGEMRERMGKLDPADVKAIMDRGIAMNRGLSAKAVEAAAGN